MPRIHASVVDADTELRFRLRVTEPSGDSSVDEMAVRVTDTVPDTVSPVTTLTSSRSQVKGVVKSLPPPAVPVLAEDWMPVGVALAKLLPMKFGVSEIDPDLSADLRANYAK